MKFGVLLSCAFASVLMVCGAASGKEGRSKTFGRDWVRSNPFVITACIQRAEAVRDSMYVDAGLNTMLTWKDRPELYEWAKRQGIPWHYHVNKRQKELTEEFKSHLDATLKANPGCTGIIVCDEPTLADMPAAAAQIEYVKQAYPHLLAYTNTYPMVWTNESMAKLAGGQWLASGIYDEPPVRYTYDDYLADIVRIMKPDVLMMDQYPFIQPPEGDPAEYYQERYFESLAAARKAALHAEIPFWLFIQAYAGNGGSRRLPSESDVRMQVFSSLAYGCTGIAYFTYDAVEEGSMLNNDFSPSRIYGDIARLNAEVSRVGQTLRFLTSTDVRYVSGGSVGIENGRVTGIPRGIGIFSSKSRVATRVQDIILGEKGEGRNAMIGFFKDDDGADYFMLVNLTHDDNLSAAAGEMTIKLRLASSVRSLTRLSRETGKLESVQVRDGEVELRLPGGTGDLFKIGEGAMPGLKQ